MKKVRLKPRTMSNSKKIRNLKATDKSLFSKDIDMENIKHENSKLLIEIVILRKRIERLESSYEKDQMEPSTKIRIYIIVILNNSLNYVAFVFSSLFFVQHFFE